MSLKMANVPVVLSPRFQRAGIGAIEKVGSPFIVTDRNNRVEANRGIQAAFFASAKPLVFRSPPPRTGNCKLINAPR